MASLVLDDLRLVGLSDPFPDEPMIASTTFERASNPTLHN